MSWPATLTLPPEMQQLFGAIAGKREAMDGFARMNAGTVSPADFFAPENVDAMTGAAASNAHDMDIAVTTRGG